MRKQGVSRGLALLLAAALLLALLPAVSIAEGEALREQDIWAEATLLSLGAELPTYDAASDSYRIETPAQLLYLSGNWKTGDSNGDGAADAPCDGKYVLTADLDMSELMASIGAVLSKEAGTSVEGYMPPIAAEAEEDQTGGVRCAFFGDLDGQGHCISNLNIVRLTSKYVGLFGNIGHDHGTGSVENLALYNIHVYGLASCGLLVGGLYGTVENCVFTGSIDCVEKTAGGVAGKVKKNDDGTIGLVQNCFVYADIHLYGQGSENGAVGGITSAQSGGGRVINCYVAGSITVDGEGAQYVGGISGNLKSGQALTGCVMRLSSIVCEDGKDVGLLCGCYSGETGSHLADNLVWAGTRMEGKPTDDHPATAAYTTVDTAALTSKALYVETAGWDFDTVWSWVGTDELGYPLPAAFADERFMEPQGLMTDDLSVTSPILRSAEPAAMSAYEGEAATLSCTLTLPENVSCSGVKLYCGTDKDASAFTTSAAMTQTEAGLWQAEFPETALGSYYYCFVADTSAGTVRWPSTETGSVKLELVSAAAKYTPKQLTLNVGATVDCVGINWITDEGGLEAQLRWRLAGENDWNTEAVTDVYTAGIAGDHGSMVSYGVTLTGLAAGTAYEYQAVCTDGDKFYASAVYGFTTLPDGDEFQCVIVSDLQATTEEGYLPFLYSMQGFVTEQLGGADYVINLGDLTEDDTLAEYASMFSTLGEWYATQLTAFTAGNHECKGDVNYTIFKAVTRLPNGMEDAAIGDTTGSFIVGDVCFVTLNTEPYSGEEGADTAADKQLYYELQKAYAKAAFEASGCRWRVVTAHAGLIQDDETATAFLMQMCDELNVDLYFNGHIHDYYRATVRNGEKVEAGEGTSFITTSPMGNKFDDFRPGTIDELLAYQTGSSQDERQYFTLLKSDKSGLTVTAYQCSVDGDKTEKSTFASFDMIDSITLTESLSEKATAAAEGTSAPSEPAAAPTSAPAAETQKGGAQWIWIAAAVVLLAVILIVVVVLLRRKRKEK